MKKILLALLLGSSLLTASAQTTTAVPRHIAVIGTAEIEIVPDEIYLSVSISEFTKDKKKYTIEELESGFVNFVEKITLTPRKDISMDGLDADLIALKRKTKDAVIRKSYEVKFKNEKQVAQLMAVMDSLHLSSANVSRYSHSKMDEYKKQIKIDAIKAAKTKADYLLEAIGAKAGKPISVDEPNGLVTVDSGFDDFRPFRGNVFQSNSRYLENNIGGSYGGAENESIGEKKIKLRYTINAQFEIQ